jgi:tryptophan synthase alpha chain
LTAERLDTRFASLAREGRAGFVAYIMAGDPDLATASAILAGLPGAGADIIELGLPFSDPVADGPTIQRAAIRARASGMTVMGALTMVRAFRERDTTTPIVLMGDLNPLLTFGLAAFVGAARQAGVDGLIVVDCPPEEAGPLADALDGEALALIRLATPTTDAARLKIVASRTRGFVYYVSVAGVTGGKEADADAIAPAVECVRAASGLPVAVGFGIRTPERAAEVARIADAAVVGSALVDEIADAIAQNGDPVAKVLNTAANLAMAVRAARTHAE